MKCQSNFKVEQYAGGPIDVDAIAGLLDELGYPRDACFVEERINIWHEDPDASLFLACSGDRTIGFLALRVIAHFVFPMRIGWITTLSVTATARRSGVASALVAAATKAAEAAGCFQLEVSTNCRRSDAHAFYEGTGFLQTHRHYTLPLNANAKEAHENTNLQHPQVGRG